MQDIVADMTFTGLYPNGKIAPIVVRIGRPYLKSEITDDFASPLFACPLEVEGLDTPTRDTLGDSSLSVLSGAIRFAVFLLKDFIERGGKLYLSEGEIDEDERVTVDFLDQIFQSKL